MIMLCSKKYIWIHVIYHALFKMHAYTQHYTDTSLHQTEISTETYSHNTTRDLK